jgi:hypothetical protein
MAQEYIDRLTLQEKIKDFSEAEKFLAEQQYDLMERMQKIEKNCISCSPPKSQTAFNAASITATIIAILDGVLLWIKTGGMSK